MAYKLINENQHEPNIKKYDNSNLDARMFIVEENLSIPNEIVWGKVVKVAKTQEKLERE